MTTALTTTILNASLNTAIGDMRSKIGNVSQEAVTGFYKDLTLKLDGDIGQAQLAKKAVDDITLDRELLTIRKTRVNITQNRLSDIDTASRNIANDARVAVNMENRFAIKASAQEAKIILEGVFSSLSVRVGQRYLFSGDATDKPPLADADTLLGDLRTIANTAIDAADFETQLDTYFTDPGGGFRTNIYLGSQNTSDPDAITALDPALTTLMRGLATLALAHPDTGSALVSGTDALITNASGTIDAGFAQLTLTQADMGRIDNRIQKDLDNLSNQEVILTANYSQLTVRDQFEAASELKLLESNLEAAYLLTSRLSSLSLINYIR